MAQPIRKKIQEIHPDVIKEREERTLLVDGTALLFMSFKDATVNSDGVHIGGIFQFLLQLKMMIAKFKPTYVYVFFDNEYSGWLRWKLYHDYKANRDKHYEDYVRNASEYMKEYEKRLKNMQNYLFNKNKPKKREKSEWDEFVDANFDRERDTLIKYFEELYVRSYMDEIVEADDLISYYCQNKEKSEKIIIMTADMDLTQLIADDIAIYDLHNKIFITPKNFTEKFGYYYENTFVKKVFCGDVSDNIGNIKGLSESGFYNLMPEAKERLVTIDEVKERARELINERVENKKKPLKVHENIINGVSNKTYDGDFYEINSKIIDLKHPILTDDAKETMDEMIHAPIDPDGRSFQNLYSYIIDDNIDVLKSGEKFSSFFSTFKKIENIEKKRFEEYLKTHIV